MYRLASILSIMVLVGLVAACSGDSPSGNDAGPGNDKGVTPTTDGTTPDPDKGVTPQPDKGPPPTEPILQSVINTMKLPTKAGQYALDLDGTGPKNQFGSLLAAMAGFGLDMQPALDEGLAEGKIIMLLELLGKDLTNDSNVLAKAYLGEDTDDDPTNNFSGSAELAIDASGQDMTLAGEIVAAELLAGPGTLAIPVPIGETALMVVVKAAKMAGTVSADGVTDGIMAGAIPESDLDGTIFPAVADLINGLEEDQKKLVLGLVDTNGDGVVDAAEIKDSLIGQALAPDIDTDNDGTPDAVSLGIGFTTVKAVIKK